MGSDRDDELARTATAVASPSAKASDLGHSATAPAGGAKPALAPGETLGRYKIERELGAGGMGIVYAAFDPDLERRVAVKVLLGAGDDAQKQRLLREARAMARLTHPNVVTVHEVATANGRDYVAMEMVEGSSLAEWLRSEKRSEEAIIAAFVAAGRGLAAAHAAGMVHRDFKPHNILRASTGRIAVTDFGLAREAHADPLAVTGVAVPPAPGTPTAGSATPSTPLAGLTMTGSVLGTPAYMAPEQWAGNAVTAATDQFAFCVAMWEALSGERPFRGDTVEMLRRAVELGPAPLDDSKLPRRLRPILRRGLEPLAKHRWPSMDALLVAITRGERKSKLPYLVAGGVVAAAGVFAIAKLTSSPAVEAVVVPDVCPKPRVEPATISLDTQRAEKAVLQAELDRWTATRAKVCEVPGDARAAKLACLDGALARLSAVADGVRALTAKLDPIEVIGYLIDPEICTRTPPPHLSPVASPELRNVIAAILVEDATPGPSDLDAIAKLVASTKGDPCAVALARTLAANTKDTAVRAVHLQEAEQSVQLCEDDRVRADVAQVIAAFSIASSVLGTPASPKLKLAELAIAKVAQPDLLAELDALKVSVALKANNRDEAIALGEKAMAEYAARGRINAKVKLGIEILDYYEHRSSPDDLQKLKTLPTTWRKEIVARYGETHPTVHAIDSWVADWRWFRGEIADATKQLEALRRPIPHRTTRRVHGKVTDPSGKPVAGATVTVGRQLVGGGSLAAMPFSWLADGMRSAVTSESGDYEIVDGPDSGLIVAQRGELRSRGGQIADTVDLVVAPTSRIEGTVDLNGNPVQRVVVSMGDTRDRGSRYEVIAPVMPDGSFVFEGAPRAKVTLYAVARNVNSERVLEGKDLVVDAPVMRGVKLAVPAPKNQRTVHVVVRSTATSPIVNAEVLVLPGTVKSMTFAEFKKQEALHGGVPMVIRYARPVELDKGPAAVVKLARPGDAFATVDQVPAGTATACAVGLPNDIADPDLDRKIRANPTKVGLECRPIPDKAEVIVIDVPPFPRLD